MQTDLIEHPLGAEMEWDPTARYNLQIEYCQFQDIAHWSPAMVPAEKEHTEARSHHPDQSTEAQT